MIKKSLTLGVAAVGLLGISLPAGAEILTGLADTGSGAWRIIRFDSETPGTILTTFQPTDSQDSTQVVLAGIDYLGTTLYGVTAGGLVYTINPFTGVCTKVHGTSVTGPLSGNYFGVDVQSDGVRIVSDQDINVLISLPNANSFTTGGTLHYNVGPSDPRVTGISSLNGGTLYGIEAGQTGLGGDELVTIDRTTGLITQVGAMGFDFSARNGFDISAATGTAWFTSTFGSSGIDSQLFALNLSTGGIAASKGVIGPGDGWVLHGLATPVPEPSSIALFALGGAGLFGLLRRRK